MRKLKVPMRVLLVVGMGLFGAAASADECAKLSTESGSVGYCIKMYDRTANQDVLYFFHGAMPDSAVDPERVLANGDPNLEERWRAQGLAPPTIISVSWGPKWTLKGNRLTSFELEVIPEIERRLGAPFGRRLVIGTSIGGVNAYLAWALLPHLFDRAAFLCAPFPRYNPYASRLTKLRIADRLSGGSRELRAHYLGVMSVLATVYKADFSSAAEWNRYQPTALMKAVAGYKPPAYVVFDRRDEFGFGAPTDIGSAGSVIFEEVDGKHCEGVMTGELARFLGRE
jgi:hypothetical protein